MTLDVKQLNSLALAYVGDAVYELKVREHVLRKGFVKPNVLHNEAVQYVSANAQAAVIRTWLDKDILTEEERAIVRRGRNAKVISPPKNISIQIYRYATAFESLIGYHYLMRNESRLDKLIGLALQSSETESLKGC